MINLSDNGKVVKMIAGTGGVAKDDLVMISSGTVVKAASGAGAVGLVGIARETKTATNVVLVELIQCGQIIEAPYTTGTKTSVTDADLGKAFGVTGPTNIGLDDTTNGVAVCVGYNNTVKTMQFIVPAAKRYV